MIASEQEQKGSRKRLASLMKGRIDKDLAVALCIGCEVYGVIDEAIAYLESKPDFTGEDFADFLYEYVPEENRLDQWNQSKEEGTKMIDGKKTYEDLNPQEKRLANLLFEVTDDEIYINTVMNMCSDGDLFDETADFIEENPECTESDLLEYIASFTEIEYIDDEEPSASADGTMKELRELLDNVSDSYYDFIVGICAAVKSREDGAQLMIDYIKAHPEATSSDIIEVLEEYGM